MSSTMPEAVPTMRRDTRHGCTPMLRLYDGPTLKKLAAARWTKEPLAFGVRVVRGERVVHESVEDFIITNLRGCTPGAQIRMYEVEVVVPYDNRLFRGGQCIVFHYDTFDRCTDMFVHE